MSVWSDTPRAARYLRAIHGRAYPRIVGSFREPSWLIYETLLPLLGTLAFGYVYRAIGAPDRFIGYVVMGGAAAAFWLNIMWNMASQLWWERKQGNLEIYMTAPCGLSPILLGMSFGGLFAVTIRATVVVLAGAAVFGVRYTITDIPLFLLVFVTAVIALYGLGTMLASIFLLWGREAWHMTNLMMEPVFLVSGMYFPVRTLGFWTGIGAAIIPLTIALDAMRGLLYPEAHPRLLSPWVELAILAALAVAFGIGARIALRKMEMIARREGRLGERL